MGPNRNKLVVLVAFGTTFVLHMILQWYSWALADGVGHRHPFPFRLLSFPVLWLTPSSLLNNSFELWLVLNSAIWAGAVGLLVMQAQRTHRTVPSG
jgi:hypothetical protein